MNKKQKLKEIAKLRQQENDDFTNMREQFRYVAHLMKHNNCNAANNNISHCQDYLGLYASWTAVYTNLQKNIRFAKECIRKVDKAFEIDYIDGIIENQASFLRSRSEQYYCEFEKKYKDPKWDRRKYLKNLFVFEIMAYRYLKNLVYPKMIYWRTRSVYSI